MLGGLSARTLSDPGFDAPRQQKRPRDLRPQPFLIMRTEYGGYAGLSRYSARTRSSNRISIPNTPMISLFSSLTGADTVMQSAPVIFDV